MATMNGTVVVNPSFNSTTSTAAAHDRSGAESVDGKESKSKSVLVVAAEKIDRRTALLTGYLKKKNSSDKWQRRYFEIVGNFWVYYKSHTSSEMLCAMDLWKASAPAIVTNPADAEAGQCEFSITWDRYRIFRAATPQEAVRWVNAIQQVQATRPAEPIDRPLVGPPTPSLAGLAKSSEASAAPKSTSDPSSSRKRGGLETDDSNRGGGGGVCSNCVIM